jgi:toxin YoeB
MKLIWFEEAWDDYVYWRTQDKKTLKRINRLLDDIVRGGHSGTGNPEPLKGELSGFWSSRIDGTNRLVYRLSGDAVEILTCLGHYATKRASAHHLVHGYVAPRLDHPAKTPRFQK